MGTLTKNVTIEIDGDKYKDYNFLNISLSQQLLRPNELSFTLQKKRLDNSMDDMNFPIPKKLMGAKVTCEIETCRFDKNDILDEDNTEFIQFKGIIFNVNIYRRSDTFSEQLIDVQAFSPDFLLMDHPHCVSYENKDLKEIITATLDKCDIKNEINPRTTGTIPYTVQYNETNYQFLTRLAQRWGEWMYHDGEKWYFGEIKQKKKVQLDARNDVLNYHFQTGLMHHKVKHVHHDYLKYEDLSQSASDFSDLTKSGYHPLTDKAKEKSNELFAKETFQHLLCSNPEKNEIDELEVSASVQLFGEKTRQVICTGGSVRADLTIGSVVAIGDQFIEDDKKKELIYHNDLMIIGIVHSTEVDGNYSNSFTAVPVISKYPPYARSDVFPFSSAQRAVVMDNKDEDKLGRIRVQFLWQKEHDPDKMMTPWIRIAQPYGGDGKGFYFIPELEEEVMVDFENGNAEKPYVVGTLWHNNQRPRTKMDQKYFDKNDIKYIRTRNGLTIGFADDHETGGGEITILDSNDRVNVITLSVDNKKITITSEGNIELTAKENIIIKADKNVTINAGGDLTEEAGSNIKAKADSNIEMEASENVAIKAGGDLTEDGSNIKATANANVEMKASASMDLSASATMTLDGGGMLEASAGMVKIN